MWVSPFSAAKCGCHLSQRAIANPYTYTGRELDAETGLYHFRNRYYHAELGRFVGRDPIRYWGGGFNLYASYWAVNGVDPSGLATIIGVAEGPIIPGMPEFITDQFSANSGAAGGNNFPSATPPFIVSDPNAPPPPWMFRPNSGPNLNDVYIHERDDLARAAGPVLDPVEAEIINNAPILENFAAAKEVATGTETEKGTQLFFSSAKEQRP